MIIVSVHLVSAREGSVTDRRSSEGHLVIGVELKNEGATAVGLQFEYLPELEAAPWTFIPSLSQGEEHTSNWRIQGVFPSEVIIAVSFRSTRGVPAQKYFRARMAQVAKGVDRLVFEPHPGPPPPKQAPS